MSSKNFQIEDLLRLYNAPNVGPATFISFVEEFGSPGEVFRRSAGELCAIKRINTERASAILSSDSSDFISSQLKAIEHTGCKLVSYWDKNIRNGLKPFSTRRRFTLSGVN